MKATGIVRRIDDLGRVVIPKEIRRTLRIREGDPLEIFTDREGEIILKKYSPIGELGTLAKLYAESLSQTLGCTVCITDTDQIVAASGSGKKELQDQFIGKELDHLLKERGQILAVNTDSSYIRVIPDMKDFQDEAICPIISEGDVIGSVVLLNKDQKKRFGEVEQRVASSAADFLGRQMG
nr:stage V sporulation protein T [uncultured Mediterraneibacter sp.]